MKAHIIAISALAAVEAFATVNEAENQKFQAIGGQYGCIVSGSGTSADLRQNYKWIVFDNADIIFSSDKHQRIDVWAKAKLSAGEKAVGVKGKTKLTFPKGSNVGLTAPNGICTTYRDAPTDPNPIPAVLTISVENGYNGKIQTNDISAMFGRSTLFLTLDAPQSIQRYNATEPTILRVMDANLYLSLSADQTFVWDIREKASLKIRISQKARLIFDASTEWIGNAATIDFGDKIDGYVCFAESIVDTDKSNFKECKITIKGASKEQTVILSGTGKANIEKIVIGGKPYYAATSLQ